MVLFSQFLYIFWFLCRKSSVIPNVLEVEALLSWNFLGGDGNLIVCGSLKQNIQIAFCVALWTVMPQQTSAVLRKDSSSLRRKSCLVSAGIVTFFSVAGPSVFWIQCDSNVDNMLMFLLFLCSIYPKSRTCLLLWEWVGTHKRSWEGS